MRLEVKFGLIDTKEITWYDKLENFPNLINYLGKNYEWAFYGKDLTGKVDMILNFCELGSHDPGYSLACPAWSDLVINSVTGCECGAKYSSFPFAHMFFCKKWVKW